MNPAHRVASRSRLLAIASGKSGTGKTFLSVNLARSLAYEGERVLLFDGDLGLANVAVQLALPKPTQFLAVLSGECAVADAAHPFMGGAKKRGGFDILAGTPGSGELADASAPVVMRTIATLRLAGGYDRVVLDLSAGVDDTVLRFATAADDVLTVLNPDPAALTDAYAFIKLFHKRTGGPVPGFTVNQAKNAKDARHTADSLINACRNFLKVTPRDFGFVRSDPKAADAVRQQGLLSVLYPDSSAADDIAVLARKLAHHGEDATAAASVQMH